MSLHDPRQHDELLNYQLKRLVTLGGAPAIRLCEGVYGVTRSEWRLVAALVEEGPRSPSALAQRARMEGARASRLVGALIGKGLVRRDEMPGDRRRATLEATPAGERLYAALFPQLAQINRRIMAALSEDEAGTLAELLRRLTVRVQEIDDAGGGVDARADRWRGGRRRGNVLLK